MMMLLRRFSKLIFSIILCVTFSILTALPIKADIQVIDVSQSAAFSLFQSLGYTLSTNNTYNSSSGNLSLTIPSQSSSVNLDSFGSQYAGVNNGKYDTTGTITTNPSYPTGTFSFSTTIQNTLVLPIVTRSGTSTDITFTDIRVVHDKDNTDFYVLSFMTDYSFVPTMSISGDGSVLNRTVSNINGSTRLMTYFIQYDGAEQSTVTLTYSYRSPWVIPIYAGQLSRMPDDLKVIAGMYEYTSDYQLLESIKSQNSLLDSIDSSLSSQNNLISSGNSQSQAASDKLDSSVSDATDSFNEYDSLESAALDDFSSDLVTPDSSFISQLSTSASWVKDQFDSLIDIHPIFPSLLTACLTIALSLVIIGKMRG